MSNHAFVLLSALSILGSTPHFLFSNDVASLVVEKHVVLSGRLEVSAVEIHEDASVFTVGDLEIDSQGDVNIEGRIVGDWSCHHGLLDWDGCKQPARHAAKCRAWGSGLQYKKSFYNLAKMHPGVQPNARQRGLRDNNSSSMWRPFLRRAATRPLSGP